VRHGLQVRKCQECGAEEVAIPNIAEAHQSITEILVARKSAFAAVELRFLRQFRGHSSKDFAKTLGVALETLSRWENASRDIPSVVDRVVRLLVVNTPQRTDYSADMSRIFGPRREGTSAWHCAFAGMVGKRTAPPRTQ